MRRESANRAGRHEPGASFVQRATRLARRIGNRKVWRSVLLGLTDPTNDSHWRFIVKRGTDAYLSSPQPWFAPGAVERLEGVVATEAKVFEWGAGASTLWFLSRGCKVVSFETDRSWIEL